MSQPYVSVVITAHNRKEYLKQAVESVLKQTVDHNDLQIIVVKNFLDGQIDAFLDENGVERVFTEEATFGRKLAAGIERSKGEMVSFLDDDDLFRKDKVKTVAEMFKKQPDLDYYHNSISTIDPAGNVTEQNISENIQEILEIGTPREGSNIRKALRYRGDWYASTISIRKSSFTDYLDYIRNASASFDRIFFYIALSKGGKLMIDPERLTFYRVHPSLTTVIDSFEVFMSRKKDFFSRSKESIGKLLDLPDDPTVSGYIRCAHLHARINLFMFSDDVSDRISGVDMIRFLKCALSRGSRYDVMWFFTAISRRIFPEFTKKRYYKYMTRLFGSFSNR